MSPEGKGNRDFTLVKSFCDQALAYFQCPCEIHTCWQEMKGSKRISESWPLAKRFQCTVCFSGLAEIVGLTMQSVQARHICGPGGIALHV